MPELAWTGVRAVERDRQVLAHRPPRATHDPWRYQDVVVEEERTTDGSIARVATVFLTGRECPWRCVMCDLWRHTIEDDTPRGAIPAQIAAARAALASRHSNASVLKLYNAGSFFDPRAVPEADDESIAASLANLHRVIVECHPALVGRRLGRFVGLLHDVAGVPRLEVAMGLETAHPGALGLLNKRMTLSQFSRASAALLARRVDVRVFLLISPPFVPAGEQDDWLMRSIEAAFSCGASAVSLVPTRPGNGLLDALARERLFMAPTIETIERNIESALRHHGARGRIFVDIWDLARFSTCTSCLNRRRTRLHAMNLEQRILPPVACAECGAGAPS